MGLSTKLKSPGIAFFETLSGPSNVAPQPLGYACMLCIAEKGEVGKVYEVINFSDYEQKLGGPVYGYYGWHTAKMFFEEGGSRLYVVKTAHYAAGVLSAAKSTVNLQGRNVGNDANVPASTLKVEALGHGTYGDLLSVSSVKAETVLETQIPAGTATSLSVANAEDFEVGDIVTLSNGTATGRSIITRKVNNQNLAMVALTTAGTYAIGSTVRTNSNHVVRTKLASSITSGDTEIELVNVSGVVKGMLMSIVNGDTNVAQHVKVNDISGKKIIVDAVAFSFTHTDTHLVVSQEFQITTYYKDVAERTWPNLSMLATNTKYHVDSNVNSKEVEVEDLDSALDDIGDIPDATEQISLANGDDGLVSLADSDFMGDSSLKNGFYAFDVQRDGFYQLLCPDARSAAVQTAQINYAEKRWWWAVLNNDFDKTYAEAKDFVVSEALFNTNHAEIAYPNVKMVNTRSGVQELVPACGAIAGMNAYVWTNPAKGPHIQPAGTEDGRFRSIVGFENYACDDNDVRDLLDENRINCLYKYPPFGLLMYGINTLEVGGLDFTQKGERIVFLFLEHSIKNGTPWFVFKNIDDQNKGRLNRTLKRFLSAARQGGLLKGLTDDEAFVIDLNSLNNSQTESQGEFFVKIGLATKKAAEFVYFDFSKKISGEV